MVDVVIYTKSYCPYSKACKEFFDEKGVKYDELSIDNDPAMTAEMEAKSGRRTDTPQVFIAGHHIGSFDDIKTLKDTGQLDKMLGL